jgi:hypothetical protein
VDGSRLARKRLEVILETIAAARTIAEACAQLGIQETQFHDLRSRALSAAASSLELGRPGRPRKEVSPDENQVAKMAADLRALRRALRAARARREIPAVKPRLPKRKKTHRGR